VKSERGVTLMSLIIYVIVLIIVAVMLAMMTNNFFRNTEILEETSRYAGEFNKFNMYFIEDVKKSTRSYSVTSSEIIFKDGTTYEYRNGEIYRDKVKLCSNITNCMFTKRIETSGGIDKEIINVQIGIDGSNNFEVNNDYVLKYW
jgi:hypothetical protein